MWTDVLRLIIDTLPHLYWAVGLLGAVACITTAIRHATEHNPEAMRFRREKLCSIERIEMARLDHERKLLESSFNSPSRGEE